MSAKIMIEYFGMPGEGKTVTEAKRDAGAKIESAMRGTYTPVILRAGEETVILFRCPQFGWQYGFLRDGNLSGIQGSGERKELERRARRHLGDLATDWRTCLDANDVHQIVKDEADRREIASNCEWQRKYHKAIDAGLDDNNARNWIGGFAQFMTQPIPDSLTAA